MMMMACQWLLLDGLTESSPECRILPLVTLGLATQRLYLLVLLCRLIGDRPPKSLSQLEGRGPSDLYCHAVVLSLRSVR